MSDTNEKAKGVPRRVALKVIGALPVAVAAGGLEAAQTAAPPKVRMRPVPVTPVKAHRFFTDHEWKTAGTLADMIIPRDAVSGSATEAGVVEFMDEWADYWGERIQAQMRGGLMWLDAECTRRFDQRFLECTDAQRRQVLDTIAYPPKQPAVMPGQPTPQPQSPAPEEGTLYSQGVSFFTLFRDLTASGFFTSEMGIKDIGYMGNQPYDWKGCPPEVLAKLGLA
jgi:hypothetical protein